MSNPKNNFRFTPGADLYRRTIAIIGSTYYAIVRDIGSWVSQENTGNVYWKPSERLGLIEKLVTFLYHNAGPKGYMSTID